MTVTPLYWGVWIPGTGWLRILGSSVAFEHEEVALETAQRIGQGARAYYLDKSLEKLESYLLERENSRKFLKKLYNYFMERFKKGR